jgi:hypothetical protein
VTSVNEPKAEACVPDQFWNVIGALTIVAAMAASHPLRASQTDLLQERLASGWHEMLTADCAGTDPDQSQCMPAFWTP